MNTRSTTGTPPVRPVVLPVCDSTGWKGQFGHPSGLAGRLTGRVMAVKNAAMNRLVAERLGLRPDHRVLEIGFGPGVLIEALARRVSRGLVAGVDPSPVMVDQARARNRRAIDEGRVELVRASAAAIPYGDGSFDLVCETNSFHHWPDPDAGLRETRRVLAAGGTLVLCLRMKHPTRSRFVAPGYTEQEVEDVMRRVERAGFVGLRAERLRAGRDVTLLFAQR